MVGVVTTITSLIARSAPMSTTTLRPILVCAAALLASACRDDVATAPPRQLRAGAPNASVSVGSSAIFLLSVEVQGDGIDPGFFYDIPIQGGVAKSNVTLPVGSDRQVRLRGYDQYGQLTHQTVLSFPKVSDGLNESRKVILDPVKEGKQVGVAFSVVGEIPLKGATMVFKQSATEVYEGSQVRIAPILVDDFGQHALDPRNVQWGVGDPMGGRIEPGTPYAYYTAEKASLGKLQVNACYGARCWGLQIANLPDPFVDLRAGEAHTCGIRSSGKVSCWGNNGYGQLGSMPAQTNRPSPVSGTWKQIAAGTAHTCAISSTSAAFCWGSNADSALGIGMSTLFSTATPTAVTGGIAFSQISAGATHTCGVSTTGVGYCWGRNTWQQLGIGQYGQWPFDLGDLDPRDHPVAIKYALHWSQLSARSLVTCGVDEQGKTMCWGYGGAIGFVSSSDVGIPANIGVPVSTATQLSQGPGGQTCVIEGVSRVTDCWGSNGVAQAGVGYTSGSPHYGVDTPTPVVAPVGGSVQTFTMVSTSERTSCAVNTSNVIYCWGDNSLDQLGTAARKDFYQETPVAVPTTNPALQFSRVATGLRHTCGLTLDGDIWCWGYNASGELGNATNVSSPAPVKVAP
jgi:alpha-tubulin suppressor-like RCC1 family protein